MVYGKTDRLSEGKKEVMERAVMEGEEGWQEKSDGRR